MLRPTQSSLPASPVNPEEIVFPYSPYSAKPDNTSKYVTSDYQSISYTYNCLNGKYITLTYFRSKSSNGPWWLEWEKTIFESDCIK